MSCWRCKKVHIFIVSFQNAKQGGNCFDPSLATRKEPYKNSLTHRCLYLLPSKYDLVNRLCCLTFCMISLPFSLGQADSFAATSNSPSKRSWERDEQWEDVSKCSVKNYLVWRFQPLWKICSSWSPQVRVKIKNIWNHHTIAVATIPRHPSTLWGSVFEPPKPLQKSLRVPNTHPHQVFGGFWMSRVILF